MMMHPQSLIIFLAIPMMRGSAAICHAPLNSFSASCEDDDNDRHTEHGPGLIIQQMQRVQNISVAEFEENYSHPDFAVPVVFENAVNDFFDASEWTRQAIAKECGHYSLILPDCEEHPYAGHDEECHQVHFVNDELVGKAWAGLELADLDVLNITTVKELLDLQDTPEGSNLYLHDASLGDICPPLMKKLYMPKYFPRDYRLIQEYSESVEEMMSEHAFPTIFISKKGASSMLHTDGDMTRFWMMGLSGKKLWRVIAPSQYSRLYPGHVWGKSFYPMEFNADVMKPDFEKYPLLNGTLVYEAILSPGDVIFIPEGWAHQVLTLEDAVSTSLNFVDLHGLGNHLKKIQFEDEEDTFYNRFLTSFMMPLDMYERENPKGSIGVEEFFRGHLLQHLPVPKSVIKWVESTGSEGINSWKSDDVPALHLAVEANFLSVVKYLLEKGADINVKDEEGDTPLTLAKDLGYDEIYEMLLEHSARHGGKRKVKK